ncbi:MAG: CHAD domain-containing protein [Massilia sp.]
MNAEQAFVAIARSCVEQIRGNENGAARDHDPDSVHQMRVGLRRLDAAFTLFRPLLHSPPALTTERNWLMDQLDPVRDWDVFVDATLPKVVRAMPEQGALEHLAAAARQHRGIVHQHLGAELTSLRFATLISSLQHWLAQRGWRDELTVKECKRLECKVTIFADTALHSANQRMHKRARKLKQATARQRHRLRIAVKRARYAAEFFTSLYPGKGLLRYQHALASLQDQLGATNDTAVALRLLDHMSAGDVQLGEGVAMVRGYLVAADQWRVRGVRKRWRQVRALALPH